LAVLRNGHPKMMGALSSPHVSITTKSTHRAECPTPTRPFFKDPLGIAQCLICKLQTHGCVQQRLTMNFLIDYLRYNVDTCSQIIDGFVESVSSDADGDDRSSWISFLFWHVLFSPYWSQWFGWCDEVFSCIEDVYKIRSFSFFGIPQNLTFFSHRY
jgi:hypothetical protein